MRISVWSSDVCSSDLPHPPHIETWDGLDGLAQANPVFDLAADGTVEGVSIAPCLGDDGVRQPNGRGCGHGALLKMDYSSICGYITTLCHSRRQDRKSTRLNSSH